MALPRLGSASIKIVFSDAEGFKVYHGQDGDVLAEVPPKNLQKSDWDRLWDVIDSIVTASRYKTGQTVAYSRDVGDRIIDFANERVREWNPRPAFTLDVADTPEGLKVIETNAISSSGFYALDMGIFVHEISQLGRST